jgi:hypothetical protein
VHSTGGPPSETNSISDGWATYKENDIDEWSIQKKTIFG